MKLQKFNETVPKKIKTNIWLYVENKTDKFEQVPAETVVKKYT